MHDCKLHYTALTRIHVHVGYGFSIDLDGYGSILTEFWDQPVTYVLDGVF